MAPTSTRRESPTPSSDPNTAQPVDEDVTRSDGEGSGGERPVREKLRDATLNNSERGRLQKKRSLEEFEEGEDEEAGEGGDTTTRHVRKRSREAVGGDDANGEGREKTPEGVALDEGEGGLTSPKGKRTRDQVKVLDAETEVSTPSEERKTKRVRDSGSPEPATEMTEAAAQTSPAKVPPTSGFANTSATSPFGALAGKDGSANAKAAPPQTSDSAFKSSGFGSFASASTSAFGAAAPKSTSPFGASAATGSASPWSAKAPTPATQPSVFAAASSNTTSGFGNTSSTSAFGSLGKSSLGGSGFGGGSALGSSAFSTLGGGAKLSSFGAPASGAPAPKIEGLSSKPAKAFGATDDSDAEEGGGEGDTDEETAGEDVAGAKSPLHEGATDGEKDKRFYKQTIETGEEGETTMFQQRAKLYAFDKVEKKWVERGSGTLKLNISEPATEDAESATTKPKLMDAPEVDEEAAVSMSSSKVHARLLLRADGSQRVVLNSPIVKGAKFGDDEEPKGQAILFLGRLAGAQAGDAGLDMLQMKVSRACFGVFKG